VVATVVAMRVLLSARLADSTLVAQALPRQSSCASSCRKAGARRPDSALSWFVVPPFRLDSAFSPTADQPRAIDEICESIDAGHKFTTLLGATGTGKTMTMAAVIERLQRPTLVIAHNKTLAAQLCNEFRTFFPDNAVEYFVSYYDYYQPEAYVPSRDLYIEKDSAINQEVDRLRHAATAACFARRDVVIVASVSCIFGLGSPETYNANMQILKRGDFVDRDELLTKLVQLQYTRNDVALGRANFRVRGETLEVFPAYAETAYRAVFFGDEVERLQHFDPLTGELIEDDMEHIAIWPASHYNVKDGTIERAVEEIGRELNERCAELEAQGKLLESHRLRQRTQYDMEMLREMGFCNGIENYSRILDGRAPGSRPYCLLDYFPDDFLCFVDESHQTVPQIGAMYQGDRSRKQTLVDYGFRLPSALDNRPQTFDEWLSITPQILFVSATPGEFERNHSARIVEQIVRPTGIVDPEVEVRQTKNQIDDLMNEVRKVVERDERVLVTTLTKKMSEDLTDYLLEMGFKVRYLHSEIDTLERIQIIRDLRLGEYDVLVGVNLLREGLDLPEVGLVAILDADKEGFLRGETSLIQTIGRAARNAQGRVLMYADKETAAMKAALDETNRRRAIQIAYNEEHGITPQSIVKGISDITEFLMSESKVPKKTKARRTRSKDEPMNATQLEQTIVELEEEMLAAADDLRFEYAARLRDEIRELRRELKDLQEAAL
jgi:excinuclease ABC subunit B